MSWFITISGILTTAAVCWFAWTKGAPAERFGALVMSAVWFVSAVVWKTSTAIGLSTFGPLRLFSDLTGDALVGATFLFLAVRYSSWWLGCAMLAEAAHFGLIAKYLAAHEGETSRHALNVFIAQTNIASFSVLGILLGGTLASWRADVLRKRKEAELAANPPPEPFAWVGTAALMKAHEKPLAKPPAQP